MQQIEIRLDDRVIEVVDQRLLPTAQQLVQFIIQLLQDVRGRQQICLLVRRAEPAMRANWAGSEFRLDERGTTLELVELFLEVRKLTGWHQ